MLIFSKFPSNKNKGKYNDKNVNKTNNPSSYPSLRIIC